MFSFTPKYGVNENSHFWFWQNYLTNFYNSENQKLYVNFFLTNVMLKYMFQTFDIVSHFLDILQNSWICSELPRLTILILWCPGAFEDSGSKLNSIVDNISRNVSSHFRVSKLKVTACCYLRPKRMRVIVLSSHCERYVVIISPFQAVIVTT